MMPIWQTTIYIIIYCPGDLGSGTNCATRNHSWSAQQLFSGACTERCNLSLAKFHVAHEAANQKTKTGLHGIDLCHAAAFAAAAGRAVAD